MSNWSTNSNEELWIIARAPIENPSACANFSWYILPSSASDISTKLNASKLSLVVFGGGCTSAAYPMVVNVSLFDQIMSEYKKALKKLVRP